MLPTKVIQLASDDSYQLKFAFTTHYHISAFRGYDGIFGICHSWLVTSLRCIIQRIPSLQPSRTCRGGAAIQDDGPMHRFFHSLASNATGADGPPAQWDQNDRTTNRATIGGFVGLEILRKLNCRTRRYPFHDWMATILDAANVPSLVKNLLVRLVLSSYEKADFTILNDKSALPLG